MGRTQTERLDGEYLDGRIDAAGVAWSYLRDAKREGEDAREVASRRDVYEMEVGNLMEAARHVAARLRGVEAR